MMHNSRVRRIFLAAAAVLTAFLALTSCAMGTAPVPSHNQIVGKWTHTAGSYQTELILRGNGEFTLADSPKGLLTQKVGSSGQLAGPLVTVSGTWHVGDKSGVKRNPSGTPFITLYLSNVPYISSFYLDVSGSGKSLRLFELFGDPDSMDRFIFKES